MKPATPTCSLCAFAGPRGGDGPGAKHILCHNAFSPHHLERLSMRGTCEKWLAFPIVNQAYWHSRNPKEKEA